MSDHDPVRVLWESMGRPDPDRPIHLVDGVCCRCGATGPGCDAIGSKAAVSSGFSDWDRLPWRGTGTNFCPPCTWAWGCRELRWYPHIITTTTARRAAPDDLRTILSTALDHTTMVSVPVSMQKHIVPFGRWSMIATDNITLPWTDDDATRFSTYQWLSSLGFNGVAIAEPAPRWQPLAKLAPSDRAQVMGAWASLDRWRQIPAYLDIAARALRTTKKQEVDEHERD